MSDLPRVLFMDHAGVLGGAELYLLDVVEPFKHTSQVLLFEEGPLLDELQKRSVPACTLAAPPALLEVKKQGGLIAAARAVPAILQLAWRVAREAVAFDVLFANSQKSLMVAALAGALSDRPVIWNLHDILTADHFSGLYRRLAVLCANYLTDRVIVNSQATRSGFQRSGGRSGKTVIVYNGIDSRPFDKAITEDVGALRRAMNLPVDAPLVGVFSRLAPWKGQHLLIQALQDLPEAHAIFVGDSLFDGDDSYADHLRKMTRRLDLEERVHFLGFRQDVPRLMCAVDVVAHTSVAPEPFGRVVVEGLLARRPVVAAGAGGVLEIIEHETTGLLVPPGDSQALSAALQRLLGRPKLANQLASQGHRKAKTTFTVEHMRRDVVHHVVQVVTRHQAQETP